MPREREISRADKIAEGSADYESICPPGVLRIENLDGQLRNLVLEPLEADHVLTKRLVNRLD
ncbi:MAG: hypothetical protein NXI30_18935 [bacterium]|nr:hypothetical protein [bacterium]